MRGSNPRHPAHKTGALTTELMEHAEKANYANFDTAQLQISRKTKTAPKKVPGGFEPPSLDSKSRVLTVTPWELLYMANLFI